MYKHQMLRGNARDCRETENSTIDFLFFPWFHRCLFTFMTPLFVADGDEVMGKGALVQTHRYVELNSGELCDGFTVHAAFQRVSRPGRIS